MFAEISGALVLAWPVCTGCLVLWVHSHGVLDRGEEGICPGEAPEACVTEAVFGFPGSFEQTGLSSQADDSCVVTTLGTVTMSSPLYL